MFNCLNNVEKHLFQTFSSVIKPERVNRFVFDLPYLMQFFKYKNLLHFEIDLYFSREIITKAVSFKHLVLFYYFKLYFTQFFRLLNIVEGQK